jgi:fucose 4-O-acetylase-like acetyltransferase
MKRNELLDIIKGISIILVVFGHCIQFGNGINFLNSNIFFDDIFFKIIYSFHMPLFMIISGYFYFFTVSKCNIKSLVESRITKLLVPIFVWNGLFCIVQFTFHIDKI